MSFDRCKTCRYVGYCTFPRSRAINECDEYEDMETAPAFDWNLQEMLRLWSTQEEQAEQN